MNQVHTKEEWEPVKKFLIESVARTINTSIMNSIPDPTEDNEYLFDTILTSVRDSVWYSRIRPVLDPIKRSSDSSILWSIYDSIYKPIDHFIGDAIRLSVWNSIWISIQNRNQR